MAQIRIGISGWRYSPWRGTFYPKGLPQRRELEYAASKFNSVEINGSFYSLQRPEFYRQWYAQTPRNFVFAVKGGRFITHMKKLKDVDEAMANFFASGVLALEEKLGPFLWQFPPGFALNFERFENFFKLLPKNSEAAADLAKQHGSKLRGRVLTRTKRKRPLRHAVEIRHPSFLVPEFFTLLRKHRIASVLADTAGLWPYTEDVTSDFVYIRLHGAEQIYVSGYTEQALDWWASRIRVWSGGCEPADVKRLGEACPQVRRGRDVYAYFDNDVKVRAPFDAMNLAAILGISQPPEQTQPDPPVRGAHSGTTPRDRWPAIRAAPALSRSRRKRSRARAL